MHIGWNPLHIDREAEEMQNCHYPTIYKWEKHYIYRPSWSVCLFSRSVVSNSLQPCPWDFSRKNTGVGCHFLLQGILPTEGWNPCLLLLLYWQADSLSTEPSGKSDALKKNPAICRYKQNKKLLFFPLSLLHAGFHYHPLRVVSMPLFLSLTYT